MRVAASLRLGFLRFPAVVFLLFPLFGCSSPDQAANQLRHEKADLQGQLAGLQSKHEGDVKLIDSLQKQLRGNQPTLETLPVERLEKLYTTHGIRLGRLTGDADLPPSTHAGTGGTASNAAGEGGFKVYVVPVDETGETIKAAGTFTVEAFDLAAAGDTHLGKWTFDDRQARDAWYGTFLHSYVLKCPWRKVPAHDGITIKVTFMDGLTGREYTQQKLEKMSLPPAAVRQAEQPNPRLPSHTSSTSPSTRPASAS